MTCWPFVLDLIMSCGYHRVGFRSRLHCSRPLCLTCLMTLLLLHVHGASFMQQGVYMLKIHMQASTCRFMYRLVHAASFVGLYMPLHGQASTCTGFYMYRLLHAAVCACFYMPFHVQASTCGCMCMFLHAVSCAGFYMPSDSGEKVTMGITTLLSMTVFLMLVAENMPPTSDVLPLIGT